MIKIQAPSAYIQGPGLIDELGVHVKRLGDRFLILAGATAIRQKREEIERSFAQEGIACVFVPFGGEVTYAEVDRVTALVQENGCNALIGMGGGKAIDTLKVVHKRTGLPFAIVPTTAATDAPCSAVAAMYNEQGIELGGEWLDRNPDIVAVDSRVIAKAPVRFLVSGMGDALATYFEARSCHENGFKNVLGTDSSLSAMMLARLCYDTLLRYGPEARFANEHGIVTPALEHVIEANTYLSGIGFESGGVCLAHAICNALLHLPECHNYYHGELVAFGALTLLAIENRPTEEITQAFSFCKAVGLPTCFADIGLAGDGAADKVRSIAHRPADREKRKNVLPAANADTVFEAMLRADALGRQE